jgi:hypothetical protein
MKEKITAASGCSSPLRRKKRWLCAEHLTFLFEDPVLLSQAPQLLALVGGYPLTLSGIYPLLFEPVAQALGGDSQITGDLGERLVGGAGQL